jgi:cell division protein FtsB
MGSGRAKPPGGSGPRGGQRRPTARPSAGPTVRTGQRAGGARPRTTSTPVRQHRPRLTGRAAVLVLVLSVLMVSYASSFRAYLEQREQLTQLTDRIDESETNIEALEREKARWADPAYQREQARKKFGFVMPGEIGYTVIDENGEPLGDVDSLSEPPASADDGRPEWYDVAWESVLLAGNPPDPSEQPQPADKLKPPKQQDD